MLYTNEKFREVVIAYLREHWEEIRDGETMAEEIGYSCRYFERKFKECFSMAFAAYLKKYKLRCACSLICQQSSLTNVGKRVGFANPQSFSKAFRKEFGVSLKGFLQSDMEIPDMPLVQEIDGYPINLLYEQITPNSRKKYGVELPVGYYAVFSVTISIFRSLKETLTEYIYKDWVSINYKQIGPVEECKERYADGIYYFYVPVQKRKQIYEKFSVTGSHTWIRYIDKHLTEHLTVPKLAKQFHYSLKHFRDTFEMHYHITPGIYLKRRKLYVAAREIYFEGANDRRSCKNCSCDGETNQVSELCETNLGFIRDVLEKYEFRSFEEFRKMFMEEFQTAPEDYRGEEYIGDDLIQYYFQHKEELKVTGVELKPFAMMGKCTGADGRKNATKMDLIDTIVHQLDLRDGQVVIWKSQKETRKHVCMVGPEVDSGDGNIYIDSRSDVVSLGTDRSKNYEKIQVQGGSYIVIESNQSKDSDNLSEMYRMLYRCAFTGWIWEHGSQVDFTRLTFVKYQNQKLYFYIPVKE